jgi:hypothetical protein
VAAAIKQKMPNVPPGALAEAGGNYAHLMAPEERSIVQQAMQAQKMQGAFDLMTERMRGAESMAQMREIAANTRAQLMANSRGQAINTPQGLYWASPEGARPLTTPDGNPITGATKLAAPATAKETNKTTKLAAPATAKETNKTKELASNVAAVTSAIDSLLNQLKSGSASAGISGAVNRAWEHVTGPLGMAQPQREFSNDMDRLKASASKLLTNMGYHSKAAQAQIDNLIKGDEIGSNAELAQHSLEALRDFLQQKYSETQPKGGGWSIEPVK